MPRRSAADLSVLRVDGRPDRLVPPATLAPDARATFLAIVKSVEPEHFRPGDVHLLCRMAVACVWSERAEHGLELDGGIVDGRPSPWIVIQEKQIRAVAVLATKLRLCPQSRVDARSAGAHREHLHRSCSVGGVASRITCSRWKEPCVVARAGRLRSVA